jgi:hypothetical protein
MPAERPVDARQDQRIKHPFRPVPDHNSKTTTMKIPLTLTDAERAEALEIAAEIQMRPSYRFARAWIARTGLATAPPTRHATSVNHMASLLELGTGAKINLETLVVALEDSGIPIISVRRCRDGSIDADVMVDERIVLDPIEQKHHGIVQRPFARIWSDDDIGVVQ